MSYEIEAVIVCDGCGRSIDYKSTGKRKSFDSAVRGIEWGGFDSGSGTTIKTGAGVMHACDECYHSSDYTYTWG